MEEGFETDFLPTGWSQTVVAWAGGPMERALKAYGDLGAIDRFDAYNGTPTLAELYPYDVVLTWSYYAYWNPAALGEVLADYVDAGGKVINLSYSMSHSSLYRLAGRFASENYVAMWNATNTEVVTFALVRLTLPTCNGGIIAVCDSGDQTQIGLSPTTGSTALAAWDNNELFVAARTTGRWYRSMTMLAFVGRDRAVARPGAQRRLWLAGGIPANKPPIAIDTVAAGAWLGSKQFLCPGRRR